jgi:hypothetical protein
LIARLKFTILYLENINEKRKGTMDKLIITVDLGHFKAFRVKEEPVGKGKIDLIESYDSMEAHGKLSDKITDQAGRFRLGGARDGITRAAGYGEPHNIKSEADKRLTKLIAKDINSLLSRENNYDAWYFAAPDEINSRILENLDPAFKSRLGKNVTANLTKFKKLDILKYFK